MAVIGDRWEQKDGRRVLRKARPVDPGERDAPERGGRRHRGRKCDYNQQLRVGEQTDERGGTGQRRQHRRSQRRRDRPWNFLLDGTANVQVAGAASARGGGPRRGNAACIDLRDQGRRGESRFARSSLGPGGISGHNRCSGRLIVTAK